VNTTGVRTGSGDKTASSSLTATTSIDTVPEWRAPGPIYRKSTFGLFTPDDPIDLPMTSVQRAAIQRVMLTE
jgi:hypothetical protein